MAIANWFCPDAVCKYFGRSAFCLSVFNTVVVIHGIPGDFGLAEVAQCCSKLAACGISTFVLKTFQQLS
eukprot:6462908-Amphidinium_carterae.1